MNRLKIGLIFAFSFTLLGGFFINPKAVNAQGIDTNPPETRINIRTVDDKGYDGWTEKDLNITLDCRDSNKGAISGCKEIRYCFDCQTPTQAITTWPRVILFNQEGRHILKTSSVDNAGNIEPVKSTDILIDRTPPVVTWQRIDPANGNPLPYDQNNWYTENLYFRLSCSDSLSGCDRLPACKSNADATGCSWGGSNSNVTDYLPPKSTGILVIDKGGEYRIGFRGEDKAGQISAEQGFFARRFEKDPLIGFKVDGFNQQVEKTVHVTCDDGGLGNCSTLKYCFNTGKDCIPNTSLASPFKVAELYKAVQFTFTRFDNTLSNRQTISLYSTEDNSACGIRIYENDANANNPALRKYLSSGFGGSDATVSVGKSYYIETVLIRDIYQSCGEEEGCKHNSKLYAYDPSITNVYQQSPENYFIDALGTYDSPLSASKGYEDDFDSYKNGAYRRLFTPERPGTLVFRGTFSNNVEDYSGGSACTRKSGFITIKAAPEPPKPFAMISVQPSCNLTTSKPEVTVKWNPSSNVTPIGDPIGPRYVVERKLSSGSYQPIDQVYDPFNSTIYLDIDDFGSPLLPGATYTYRIIAVNEDGQTPSTNELPGAIPNCTGTGPTIIIEQPKSACYATVADVLPFIFQITDPDGVNSVNYSLTGPINSSGVASYVSGDEWRVNSIPGLTEGDYSLTVTATDSSVIPQSKTSNIVPFKISASCGDAFLQTTEGDVHSNEGIDLPKPSTAP